MFYTIFISTQAYTKYIRYIGMVMVHFGSPMWDEYKAQLDTCDLHSKRTRIIPPGNQIFTVKQYNELGIEWVR